MPRKTPKQLRSVRVQSEPIARQIREALDPEKASSKPKTWRDMTKDERAAITAAYKRR